MCDAGKSHDLHTDLPLPRWFHQILVVMRYGFECGVESNSASISYTTKHIHQVLTEKATEHTKSSISEDALPEPLKLVKVNTMIQHLQYYMYI